MPQPKLGRLQVVNGSSSCLLCGDGRRLSVASVKICHPNKLQLLQITTYYARVSCGKFWAPNDFEGGRMLMILSFDTGSFFVKFILFYNALATLCLFVRTLVVEDVFIINEFDEIN